MVESLDAVRELRGNYMLEFMWDFHDELAMEDFEKLTDIEVSANRALMSFVRKSEDASELAEKVRSEIEARARIEDKDPELFQDYAEDIVELSLKYNPEVIDKIESVSDHTWSDVRSALTKTDSLNDSEMMFRNWFDSWSNAMSPDQLSDAMKEQYIQEKRSDPQRAKYFESAVEKIFSGLGMKEYRQVLDEVENLAETDSDFYLDEIERLAEDSKDEINEDVYSEIKLLINDAESSSELAAYTQTFIEHERNRSRELAREFEKAVEQIYKQALPTEPIEE